MTLVFNQIRKGQTQLNVYFIQSSADFIYCGPLVLAAAGNVTLPRGARGLGVEVGVGGVVTHGERPLLAGRIVTRVKTTVGLQPELTAFATPVAARRTAEGRPNKTTSAAAPNSDSCASGRRAGGREPLSRSSSGPGDGCARGGGT